jgi:AcrR family transcriptional regulator
MPADTTQVAETDASEGSETATNAADGAPDARTALLDAAERLLIERGYAAASTRVVATEAGVNHGLVHYYFGSIDNLLLASLDRFTDRLLERQRQMYAEDRPFIEKWRTAMQFLQSEDRDDGYEKLWLEMQAMAWNNPTMREHLADQTRRWRQVVFDAIDGALDEYGIDRAVVPVAALSTLVSTFNQGISLEALIGVTDGHHELLEAIDDWLVTLGADIASPGNKARR